MSHLLLVVNPGSTSTKAAIFRDHEELVSKNINHSAEELAQFSGVIDQMEFRYKKIDEFDLPNEQFYIFHIQISYSHFFPFQYYTIHFENT